MHLTRFCALPRARALAAILLTVFVAACAAPEDTVTRTVPYAFDEGYGPLEDGEYVLPHVDTSFTAGVNKRALVTYAGGEAPGTIVVDPFAKFLFYVLEGGQAMRYPIAVGREGKGFRGSATVQVKREWPGWTPTRNMIRSEPEVYAKYADGIPGGLRSPLGARALYLYRGGRDTYYRIHGTNDLPSIGHNSSAGCIRLFNQDIIDLYNRVEPGTVVRVRTLEESEATEGYEMAHRGDSYAPTVADIDAAIGQQVALN